MANMLALVTSVMHIKHTEESSKHSLLCLQKQEWYGTKLLFFFYYFYMVPHGRKLSTVVKFLKKQFLWTRQVHILFFFNIIWNALTIPIYLSRCMNLVSIVKLLKNSCELSHRLITTFQLQNKAGISCCNMARKELNFYNGNLVSAPLYCMSTRE